MRSRLAAAGLTAAVVLSFAPAWADEPADHLTDIAGDANGLNAAGIEQDTRPASYDPADLVGVGIETLYETVSAGNGVRHEPTALQVTFRTTATPTLPDARSSMVYRLAQTIDGVGVQLQTWLYREDRGAPVRAFPFIHVDETCPQGVGLCTISGDEEWTAVIEDRALVMTFPFSTLDPEEMDLIGPGSVLAAPSAESVAAYFLAGAAGNNIPSIEVEGGYPVDVSPPGADFTVGSDVPPDAA